MPKRSGEKRDFMQVAREVVERAIGEQMDGSPLETVEDKRNPHAVALGKTGGKKGGAARAKALTPARRRAIAKKAAQSRWKGSRNNS
jgi:ribosomal protein S6E (S10)